MEIKRINNKLDNKSFIEKAPDEIITTQKVRLDDYEKLKKKNLNFLLIVEILRLIILQNIIKQVVYHLNLFQINKK